jgi:hypothetical protein
LRPVRPLNLPRFNSFVQDLLLTPLIAAIGGQPDFSSLYFSP